MKLSQLYGGIVGGIVFGLIGGLLLGSCVFKSGPNHQTVSAERPGPAGSGMGGGETEGPAGAPGGMDPGSGTMEAVFARVASLKSAIEKDPRDRGALVELANLYYDAGKFEPALLLYEKALVVDRNDPNLLTDTGNCYWRTGNTVRAVELFKEAQSRYPNHWQSAANLFYLSVSLGDPATAGQALEKVRRVNPTFEKLPEMQKLYEGLNDAGRAAGAG